MEEEIKIEYYESFETDPLCDKHFSMSQENIEIDIATKENTCFNVEPCTANDYNKAFCNGFSEYEKYINKDTENQTTWYKSIDNTGRYLCKLCELKYSTLQTLRYHVKTKHPAEAKQIKENIVRSKRKSRLKCQICKKQFKELLTLKTHFLNNHSLEDIKMSCFYCDATFRTENEMKLHLIVQHKKAFKKSTYMCNICGYRTNIKSHYDQHKNTHIGDKSNKCRYCDYATNYLPNLKIHERIHTNEKVYSCDYVNCEYRCSAKSALRSHRLKHFPQENILYCDKCNYKTIYRQCLKRHMDCHKRNSVRLKLC